MRWLVLVCVFPAVAFGQGVVRPNAAQTFTASAASGVAGFRCAVDGCRFDLGTGANDHFYSDGSNANTPGSIVAGGSFIASGGVEGISFRFNSAVSLPTCAAAFEGRMYRVASTGGTGTGVRTKICICTSDGAASPAYVWQRLNDPSLTLAGSLGTNATCP